MKTKLQSRKFWLAILSLCLLVGACSPSSTPPRASIPKAPTIPKVETAEVEALAGELEASREALDKAHSKAAEANNKAQSTTSQLREAMARANALAEGQDLITQAWMEAETFAAQLESELEDTHTALTQTSRELAHLRSTTDRLSKEVSTLRTSAEVNEALVNEQRNKLISQNEDLSRMNTVVIDYEKRSAVFQKEESRLKKHRLVLSSISAGLIILIFFIIK